MSESEEYQSGAESVSLESCVSEDEIQDIEQALTKNSKEKSFSNAIQRILEKPTIENRAPILSRNTIEKRIDDKKLEAKALKMLSKEKKQRKAVDHVQRPGEGDARAIEFERKLRKVATRGVVKLFNAIRVAQSSAEKISKESLMNNSVPQVTKETFLQAINKSEASSVEVQPVEWLKNDFVTEHKKHWDESSQDEQVY